MIKQADIQSTLSDAENLLENWRKFREIFLKVFTTEPLVKEDEQKFLEVKSGIAKYQRLVNQKIERDIKFLTDQMQNVLRQSISISHLRSIPEPDRKKLYNTIHIVYINILSIVGAYRFMAEGYHPHQKNYKPSAKEKLINNMKNKYFLISVGVVIILIVGFLLYRNS